MCDSYGAAEPLLVSVRSIVAPGYLPCTAASTLVLVSPVSAVSPAPPCPRPPCRPARPWSSWTAVALNEASTNTTCSLPGEVLTWAWYGVPYGPPASVRSTVAPGTLARAAALTLAATPLESAARCRGCCVAVEGLLVSAARAVGAPPRPTAPSAATVTAALRMVVAIGDVPP